MASDSKKAPGATFELERGYRRMIIPAVIAVAIFAVVPLAGMLALSFSDYHLIRGTNGEFGFRNFIKIVGDKRLINSIYVMAVLSLFGVAAQVVIGTAVAVGLQKIVGKWRLGRILFLVPYAAVSYTHLTLPTICSV